MSDSDGDSVRSAHGSPAHSPGYSPSSPDYGPNGNGEYEDPDPRLRPRNSEYDPRNPSYSPASPGGVAGPSNNRRSRSPRSPSPSQYGFDSGRYDTKDFDNEDFKVPIVASGGFELHFPDLKTQGSKRRKPMKIEKSFGLLKKDNSVLKFRIKVNESAHGTHLHSFNMELIYLGEHSIDCRIIVASATRKSEDSNHKNFTKRLISETQWGSECPIMLKNMTNFKELFTLSHSSNSRVVYLEVGQMYQENSASTSFSDMFNDENTSDFTIKCQDKYFHVHQLILKKRSEHFSAILRNDFVEMKVKQVVWDDSDPKIVEMLLRYLYNNTVQFKDFDEALDLMVIADKYLFMELSDTCDSFLAQDCANKNVQTVSKKNIKPYLKQAIEGANMVRAPKWTAAIFQKRIEDASKCWQNTNGQHNLEDFWSDLISKNPDFVSLAAKTTRKDYYSWLDQHRSWGFMPYVDQKSRAQKREKPNDLVFIVGPQGEMEGAVQCAKV